MSLQPTDRRDIDRASTAPFLLRCYWRQNRDLSSNDFSIAPPTDPAAQGVNDYSQLLPGPIRQQSVQIYTWPTCTLGELTGLLTSVLPEGVLPRPAAGTRLVYKLIFPDTRAEVREGGRGKWQEKPLGNVVIGARDAELDDGYAADGGDPIGDSLEGDANKTLSDARFVIGDYVACAIYPPTQDGRVPPVPPPRAMRPDPYDARGRGPPPPRENGHGGYGGYGGGYGGRGGGGDGYRGGYGGRGGGFGAAPPPGDWRRGERPPGGGYGGGYGGGGYGRGRGGRPY